MNSTKNSSPLTGSISNEYVTARLTNYIQNIGQSSVESYQAQYNAQLGEDVSPDVQALVIEEPEDELYPLLDQHIPNGLKSIFKDENIIHHTLSTLPEGRFIFAQMHMPIYWLNDPYAAGRRLAAELFRSISSSAVKPMRHGLSISLANVAEQTGNIGQFILGLDEGCEALGMPAQEKSLELKFDQAEFSIAFFALGKYKEDAQTLPLSFTSEDQHIYVLGREHGHLGLSAYLNDAHSATEGGIPEVHFDRELLLSSFIAEMHEAGYLTACRSVSIGGIGLALAEMSLKAKIGVGVGGIGNASFWYGEDQARFVVTIKTAEMAKFEVAAQNAGISLLEIGNTEEDALSFNNQSIKLSELLTDKTKV